MAMGRRKRRQRQKDLWVAVCDMPRTAAHPFYRKLNELLDEHGFDHFVEGLCEKFYAPTMGRPSLVPGIYFRSLLIGYFEGIDSERGIGWRIGDSLSLRHFLQVEFDEATPEHSTISRTRRLIDLETHRAVFGWVLQLVAKAGLLKGGTIGVDATTLEANAALRTIVRRASGESYEEFLTRLAAESGIETPTREQLAKLDKKRNNKGSNKDWRHPHDPDAKITKMKDGRTHLAHKAEQAVDLETGAVLAVTLEGADQGDTTTLAETLSEAAEQVAAVAADEQANEQMAAAGITEVVADKGYHSNDVLTDLTDLEIRCYISEPDRGRRRWRGKPQARAAVYANRRRIRGARGRRLLRWRAERVERSFAHLYDRGGMRRTHLRGRRNICKRLLIQVSGFNLSLVLRQKLGAGTPRGVRVAKKALRRLEKQLSRRLQTARRTWRRCRHALGWTFFEAKLQSPFQASAPLAENDYFCHGLLGRIESQRERIAAEGSALKEQSGRGVECNEMRRGLPAARSLLLPFAGTGVRVQTPRYLQCVVHCAEYRRDGGHRDERRDHSLRPACPDHIIQQDRNQRNELNHGIRLAQ